MDTKKIQDQADQFKSYALIPGYVIGAALLAVLAIAGYGANDVYTGLLLNP